VVDADDPGDADPTGEVGEAGVRPVSRIFRELLPGDRRDW